MQSIRLRSSAQRASSNGQYQVPAFTNKLFGTRFKLIPGFKTTAEIYLAMERNEVDGIYGGYEILAEVRPDWAAERRFNWLAQLYDGRAADYPDVPSLQELAQSDMDRDALQFLARGRSPGKSFITPPEVPPARLAALRQAFTDMLNDPSFRADFAKSTQRLNPRTWQDSERVIREIVETPLTTVSHARQLLNTRD